MSIRTRWFLLPNRTRRLVNTTLAPRQICVKFMKEVDWVNQWVHQRRKLYGESSKRYKPNTKSFPFTQHIHVYGKWLYGLQQKWPNVLDHNTLSSMTIWVPRQPGKMNKSESWHTVCICLCIYSPKHENFAQKTVVITAQTQIHINLFKAILLFTTLWWKIVQL